MKNPLKNFPHSTYRDGVAILKMIAPVAAIIFVSFYFHHFVVDAILANLAVNGLIISIAAYGIILIIMRFWGARDDFQVIERFGREAKAGVSMHELLEEPWIRQRYVRHYLKHVAYASGGGAREQYSIESELHALSGEYASKLDLPQFLVGFMIALGLLGTFIGLLETLTGISGMLDGMGKGEANPQEQFLQLVAELRKPLAGMGIAFSASMFGLVTSLMLAIMMINLRRYISRVLYCARNVMHDLTEIGRSAAAAPSAGVPMVGGGGGYARSDQPRVNAGEIEAISQDVLPPPMVEGEVASGQMLPQEDQYLLASRLDSLATKLDVLFSSFESSINATTRLNDLLGFGPRMKEISERTLEEIRTMAAHNIQQQELSQQVVDTNNGILSAIQSMLDIERRSKAETALSFKGLQEGINSINETSISSARHLWEIREGFLKMSTSSGMVESISNHVGHQALLLQAMLDESRNSQKWLAAIQQQLSAARG